MKLHTCLAIFLTLISCPVAQGREILVDDPGVDNTVHLIQAVPNILGNPGGKDPILKISSNVPVSILRYNDNKYLQGAEALQKQEVYLVVKSNCVAQDAVSGVQIEYTEYNRTAYSGWDTSNYTDSISIFVDPNESTTLVNDELTPSSFLAYWDYTSRFCEGAQEQEPPSTPAPTPATGTEIQTTQGGSGSADELQAPPVNPSPAPSVDESAGTARSGMLVTLLAGIFGAAVFVRDSSHTRNGGIKALTAVAMIGALVVYVQTVDNDNLAEQRVLENSITSSGSQGRVLQSEMCAASVEIIIDGCRRSDLDSKIDIEVAAPNARIFDVAFTELSRKPKRENTCTTEYVAHLDFNTEEVPLPDPGVATERAAEAPGQTFFIPSMADNWAFGVQCSRPVEGRPFVDADGLQLQALVMNEDSTKAAWSIPNEASYIKSDISMDDELGKEWTERALGEHASVPAFAAFTIALMSNNAPPTLVQDALTAAMDEVRHAETSFEVASLLLGTVIEPGPIPPSTHTFGQNMTALALAAAQEGCIDETLSALVAAYEVDTRIEQNPRINDATKAVLKEKIRTIALEETRHSALAWRTVRWACEMDAEVCSAVRRTSFASENLLQAFEKRFGRYDLDANAQTAWQKVHSRLIPLVTQSTEPNHQTMDCESVAAQRRLTSDVQGADTLLEQMATRIIQDTICAITQ